MFKRRGRKPAGILVLVLMLSTLLAACGGGTTSGGASGENTDNGSAQQNEGSTTTALSGTIEIDGSSTLHPLTEAIAEEFGAANPDVRIPIGTGGTGGGFKRFNNGEIPISNASRPIKDTEAEEAKSKGITYHEVLVAYDGLSVVVNPSNEFVDKLTVDELKKIYEPNSTVKTWADVREGWPAEEIKIYSPGTDHGTFDYFTEAINGEAQASRNDSQITFSADTNAVVQGVAGDKNSIGYFGFSFYEENQDKLKLVPIDNGTATVAPSMETIKDNSYAPLSRPLLLYVNDKELERPEVSAFMTFYLDNAASLAGEVGFVPLQDEQYQEEKDKLAK
ncbi:PstS family phosphate ABC transporter substrate-binding protein [Paenibacillus lautus]|uniref:Phosphate-binding protein n=1 Tax=Paenibacillus lautus TaxID=1401 RepID=A0A385TJC6_PAELA|nr:PstS family phosphate ABC transporter substrate-binding protein [Paenibacillus lautus]AYB42744.1 PstS family phosphate ABC transporter substrate-binding protein [Paenibacillus lautus]MBY0160600.1 PstS family phosphate ABC transporter substrate-binding protein [Cytobacillus firmus]MCI1775177.1 PstS family phosphate ABC transporter substrate-binding protein [Paenibacillus lautus]VTR56951.1 phosphate binding protein [Actinobacillus pleuropneumoniae]